MTADPADLSARMIEAAARGICHADCSENFLAATGVPACPRATDCMEHHAHLTEARAALAAAVREAGLDAAELRAVARGNEWHADNLAGAGFSAAPASYDRTAALLRALAGIADAE